MEITFYCTNTVNTLEKQKGKRRGSNWGNRLSADLCTIQKKTDMTHGPCMVAVDPATGQQKSKRTYAEGQKKTEREREREREMLTYLYT